MHMVLIDDSVSYDGATPSWQPLGGAERALIGLAEALVRRGHRVTAVTRCDYPKTVRGVSWVPFEQTRPAEADVLIAWRNPALLRGMRLVKRRVLWAIRSGTWLNHPRRQQLLDEFRPLLVFLSRSHRETFTPWRDFPIAVVEPGLSEPYCKGGVRASERPEPPQVIFTSHPLQGLSEVLDLWCARIHPAAPEAVLQVYSASLHRAAQGEPPPERLATIFAKVSQAEAQGVEIHRPAGDERMAQIYGEAALHLYPRIAEEMYGWTLAESQACGCPGIVQGEDFAGERVRNAQTGYVVPDSRALANVAEHLLSHPKVRYTLSRDALTLQAGRTWDMAAAEFEALL